jgi:hypothetical protein
MPTPFRDASLDAAKKAHLPLSTWCRLRIIEAYEGSGPDQALEAREKTRRDLTQAALAEALRALREIAAD